MRPPEEIKKELVQSWLKKAEDDLTVARILFEHEAKLWASVGFHAQQAAEKFLKAWLTWHQAEFPKTHDLGDLLDLVTEIDAELAASLSDIDLLSSYGVEPRYPGDYPPLKEDDASDAINLANNARDSILKSLSPDFSSA